ncbi:MAG: hypothetical protein IJ274_07650, partial [Lachnospiraceae bacterium]|nr:hypothetical protein [Lachnospiraceae bacterium]
MKTKRGTMKKLIATLVCMAVVGTGIYVMPQTDASATESEATFQKQSYSAWKDVVPVNGSFEVGKEGMEVYGWSLVPMDRVQDIIIPENSTAAFSLTTEIDGGSKVAAFRKIGGKGGYGAMQSKVMNVDGNTDYRVEFDYRLKELSVVAGQEENTGNIFFNDFKFVVEEIDGDNNSTFKAYALGEYAGKQSDVWNTCTEQFKTAATTSQVRFYFKISAGLYREVIALVDNVSLEKHNDYAVVNGDFSKKNYEPEGGRVAGDPGVAGWTLT